jgi:hypothetical protein
MVESFIAAGSRRLFSRTLVAALNGLADRPWRQLRNGNGITEQWLAMQLAPYGVRPRTMRLKEMVAKGYGCEEVADAFQR